VARAWNIFSVSREPRDENQLTKMLAWLADAVPAVRSALLELAFGERVDGVDVEITTEHRIAQGRLDAFLSSPSVALVVESKLGSGYGDGQLMKYLAWLHAEFADRPYRGLITLTRRGADPWPLGAKEFAAERGIKAQDGSWEELHAALTPLTIDETDQQGLESDQLVHQRDLRGQLVDEFLEMLSDEDLVPIPPLTVDELQAKWNESWLVVERYRDFFHACKDEIAEALDASPIGSSKSDRGDWFWQDYAFPNGARLVVGLYRTDDDQKAPGYIPSHTPIVFMAANYESEAKQATYAKLDDDTPDGWYKDVRWYGERPGVWRPLTPLLTATSFDEQRAALAGAVSVGRDWIEHAITSDGPPGPSEPGS
jgi:hypothetical protein